MGFVKSAAEIERIQATLAAPRFVNAQVLAVTFLTRERIVEAILPPGFEAAEEPRVTIQLGRWQSNCCGDFSGGSVKLAARFGGVDGDYPLSMYMDSDHAITFGRDLFGEPKRAGEASLFRRPGGFTGFIERGGVRLAELELDAVEELGPTRGVANNFNIKARPAADGIGLEEDALITCATFETEARATVEGLASLSLRGSVHDPLDELEVVEVLGGRYVEADVSAASRVVGSIPAADFLPYFYGRNGDDWSALDTSRRRSGPAAAD